MFLPFSSPRLFPRPLKPLAQTTNISSLLFFYRGLITPPLIQHTGYGAYIFFAIFCAASFVWTWLFVPETKGKTLEEMDRVFGDEGLSLVEEERRERIAREIMGGGSSSSSGGIGGERKEGVV